MSFGKQICLNCFPFHTGRKPIVETIVSSDVKVIKIVVTKLCEKCDNCEKETLELGQRTSGGEIKVGKVVGNLVLENEEK